jgi:putative Mg2+ transporter-C (MgtC) family protein
MLFDEMALNPAWTAISVRLLLTVLAGVVVGLDRGVRGHSAGLRTTILVTLAASVAMMEANVLLTVGGKHPDSFGIMDLMRLPLGILTGIGFIGGGAILKRGDLVTGVTTAATLWLMTVIGLCLGGGQLSLGVTATLITLITLQAARWIEVRLPREQHAMLAITGQTDLDFVPALSALVVSSGYEARLRRQAIDGNAGSARYWFDIWWQRAEIEGAPLDLVRLIKDRYSTASVEMVSEGRHRPW